MPGRRRNRCAAFKREVGAEYHTSEPLQVQSRRDGLSRNPIGIRIDKAGGKSLR